MRIEFTEGPTLMADWGYCANTGIHWGDTGIYTLGRTLSPHAFVTSLQSLCVKC